MTEFRIADGPSPSFHQGIIGYEGRAVAVVWVRDTALLAIAAPRDLAFAPARVAGPLTFLEVPGLAAALTEAEGFRLLTLTELAGPVDTAEWSSIRQEDMQYWCPDSLGEARFNYWD
ncbi:hypothetical protein [Hamadaea tsunoensis]|uniref:hypothetical protein n=1 Tax=Hamadaea tsunoensis TaxID=53368 RepID=UPI001B7FD689|nr:hypothetical protein [Hamadaea tsunoensis]